MIHWQHKQQRLISLHWKCVRAMTQPERFKQENWIRMSVWETFQGIHLSLDCSKRISSLNHVDETKINHIPGVFVSAPQWRVCRRPNRPSLWAQTGSTSLPSVPFPSCFSSSITRRGADAGAFTEPPSRAPTPLLHFIFLQSSLRAPA